MSSENFAVLRVEKLKTVGAVSAAFSHNLRQGNVSSVDEKKVGKWRELVKMTPEYFLSMLPQKRRKDAVLGAEMILSASPEFFQEHPDKLSDWTKANKEWLDLNYPGQVCSLVLHCDEGAPHLHCILSCVKDEKLNYKKAIVDGPKGLVALQDSYAKAMSPFSLNRGIRGSQRKHQKPKAVSPDFVDASLYKTERAARKAHERQLFLLTEKLQGIQQTLSTLVAAFNVLLEHRLSIPLSDDDKARLKDFLKPIVSKKRQEAEDQKAADEERKWKAAAGRKEPFTEEAAAIPKALNKSMLTNRATKTPLNRVRPTNG